MAQKETCILTNMCMVCDGENVLVQERVDPDWPGLTFPGGHVEPHESFVDSVVREVKEETGLDIDNVRLCGVKQWTSRDGSYRYIVLFFKTNVFTGELRSSNEGRVFWLNKNEITNHILAHDFDSMLQVFLNDELTENYHYFENGEWLVKNI